MEMIKKIALIIVCIGFFVTPVISQSRKEYDKAEALGKQAITKLAAGDIKAGEELINRAIDLYPTGEAYSYAFALMKLSDLSGANAVLERAVEKVKLFPKDEILVDLHKVQKIDRNTAIVLFKMLAVMVNKHAGDRKWLLKSLTAAQEPLLTVKKDPAGAFVYETQLSLKVQLLAHEGAYDEAINFTRERIIGTYYKAADQKLDLWSLAIKKGDFNEALEVAKSEADENMRGALMLMVYISLGDDENSVRYYEQFAKIAATSATKEKSILNYFKARIDLNKKDYRNALKNYNIFIKARTDNKDEALVMGALETWEDYKLLGDIYAGLKNYEKARDNYNISLLYYPEYRPSMEALTALEVKHANETSVDKTAPVIVLLEPSSNRGFKVTTAGENVMIKGIATDPSGIKEVKINNKIVYAQKGGDFWGEVVLNEGMNKVSIAATDLAGNRVEKFFDVERQIAKANASDEIVPVAETEGKNYCLLIAVQNYSDNNILSLTNPVADAIKLKLLFKNNYNFADENIITLFNPELNDVKRQLLELTYLLQPEDNLVIFYAGHGTWVEKEKKGYWLLTDAKRHDVNTWLPNKTVLDLIAKVPSRHTLLITDACFSGSVFKTRGLGKDAPTAMKEMDEKISRVAITSGNDTEVPDESVFMKYLIKALSENKDKYLTAQKMFINDIIEAVMTETKTEPRYGTLELAGHIGGDYIFSKK